MRPIVINPKAVPYANLYGEYDLQTFEWTDGVLAKVMREVCADEKLDEKWLLFDGPVRACTAHADRVDEHRNLINGFIAALNYIRSTRCGSSR